MPDDSNEVWDDAVSLALKRVCHAWAVTLSLWLFSFILVMLQTLTGDLNTAILFVPMWLGSIYVIVFIPTIMHSMCTNAHLVMPEQRLFLQAREQSNNEAQYIDYESLPMLRRLFFWGGITVLFAVMATITQVLLYLWLIAGAIGMWSALCPVIIMIIFLLCYMFVLKTISIETCLLCSLLFLDMVLFAVKVSLEIPQLPWTVVAVPIGIVQFTWSTQILNVYYRFLQGALIITTRQTIASVLYMTSFLLCLVAEWITCSAELTESSSSSSSDSGKIIWVFGGSAFAIGAILILLEEGDFVAKTRGYTVPLPLTRTREGWDTVAGPETTSSLLLGTIAIVDRSRVNAINGETMGVNSSNRAHFLEQDHYGATNVEFGLAGMGRGIERQFQATRWAGPPPVAESRVSNDNLAEDPAFSVSLPKH